MAERKWLQVTLFGLLSFVVGAILYQRVHYTIDVIGGLFVAWQVRIGVKSLFGKLG